jgi:hypothetical protein
MRFASCFALLPAALLLAACEAPPKPPAAQAAKAAAPPKYVETGSHLPTDHPQVYPDLGVMSQKALQDAVGDHTGPGYNQAVPGSTPQ